MGNKINPVGLRIGVNKDWVSRWYANKKDYKKLLEEDAVIRKMVEKDLGHAGICSILIERAAHQVNVTIKAAKPGIVIGRGGESIKKLRDTLDRIVPGGTVAVNVEEVPNANISAPLVAQRVAEQLERRFAFRRAMQQAVQRVMESGAKGIKVVVSGRLGGAEQGRTEMRMDGRVPLHTLRADIDYGFAEASTTYGRLGVKVIVFKGEVIGKQTTAKVIRNKPMDRDRNEGDRPRRRRPQARGKRPGREERTEENAAS